MDQISNMLISIKNGGMSGKDSVVVPSSKLKYEIALCLEKEGYIASVAKKTKKGIPVLELGLLYVDKAPKVKDVERISKQSRRVYFGVKDIHTVRNNRGLLVLSTPKGILSGREARKEQVGGEALFKVW
jgi:small subunit ribosomal protein S8